MSPARSRPPGIGARCRGEQGQALIEAALCSLLLFFLVFGLAESARVVWAYGNVAYGAREGSRFAVVRGSESGRATNAGDVQTHVRQIPGLGNAVVTTTWPTNNNPGSIVQVQVAQSFVPLVPFLPSIALSSTSRMVISF
jgi:Flp pilus assembly protein TadG